MKYTSIRPIDTPPRIVGRLPFRYAQELQEFLEQLFHKAMGGIPAGFNDVAPVDVMAGIAADAGTELTGWAAADHVHAILTDDALALTPVSVNTEGSSPALARADHTHDMSRVMADVMSKVSLGF
jgi:hypothetical protein